MFCFKCSKRIDVDSKFCEFCGTYVKDESKSAKVEVPESSQTKPKKKQSYLNWLLWWKLDEEEITRQIDKYNELKFTESARGVATICLLLSITISLLFTFISNSDLWLDIFLMAVIAIFVYKGNKIALFSAMIYWTITKLIQITEGSIGTTSPITSIIWWAIYMHAFYLAFKVEVLRNKLKEV